MGVNILMAEELPKPLACYQEYTQGEDIEAYLSCFADDAVMIDVKRSFQGREAIRRWAQREVIPHGSTFETIEILSEGPGYYKTLVKWLSWRVHYHYWFDDRGRIVKMSLQYRDTGATDNVEVYDRLPAAVKLYFDAVKAESNGMLEECFVTGAGITVVSRELRGIDQIFRFAENEVYGGEYILEDILSMTDGRVKILLQFTPRGWENPEPPAVYDITLRQGRIENMDLQYAR
jgi:hypothetical protein